MLRIRFILLLILFPVATLKAQTYSVGGVIRDAQTRETLPAAAIVVPGTDIAGFSDNNGRFRLSVPDSLIAGKLVISYAGYEKDTLNFAPGTDLEVKLKQQKNLDEVVVTGTMKAVSRSESPIPVEIFTPKYFKKNPTP